MKTHKAVPMIVAVCVLAFTAQPADSQNQPAPSGVHVHMVITDAALREDAELPPPQKEDVKVRQGKTPLLPRARTPPYS